MSERVYADILRRVRGRAASVLIAALAFGLVVLYGVIVVLIFRK